MKQVLYVSGWHVETGALVDQFTIGNPTTKVKMTLPAFDMFDFAMNPY